jgi:hypothetical protein
MKGNLMPQLPPLPTDFSADRRAIAERIAAGEWLLPGEVGTLLGVDRSTVHRMLVAGLIKFRYRLGAGVRRARECNPDDVIKQLSERLYEHRGPNG